MDEVERDVFRERINSLGRATDIVYSEFSRGLQSVEQTSAIILEFGFERRGLTDAALFRAGRVFGRYRAEFAGPKLNVLPDFLVGALAAEIGEPLMTTNPADFLTYFEGLELIRPFPQGPHAEPLAAEEVEPEQ